MPTVFERLKALLATDFAIPPESIREDSHFRLDLRLDSLSLVDLALLVQKDFGIKASLDEFRDCRTVGALAQAIARRLEAPSP